jgi:hypothetical protein
LSPLRRFTSILLAMIVALGAPEFAHAFQSLGMQQSFVSGSDTKGAFALVKGQVAAPIYDSSTDSPSVLRAVGDLRADIRRVSGQEPKAISDTSPSGHFIVIVGTIGHDPLLDSLITAGKLDVHAVAGKWESYVIATVKNPMPRVDQALVIAGSDRRGTIYGIYEISEQIGVSPWYWWADVPAQHHPELFITPGAYVQGPPAVKYRGIFINDEAPAFAGWAKAKYGGVNSKVYAHVFELLLRLRANYLWPAMWANAFNEDDPQSPVVADLYGIVMGTSHHEPLLRSQQEWDRHREQYGNGEWNYATNGEGLRRFWTDGVVRNKNYENLYTMGIRGDGDVAMADAGGLEANKKLLEHVIHDQQQILAKNVNPDLSKVPQLWALFTEVQKYYDAGLKVPDDVTLLFTDDNVGNLRRVPTPDERKRSGGAGVYYHLDMNGGPFSYKWLNSNPLPKIWEQMNLAHQYGANRIWIANVGDIKPLEIPLEFFLRMAWSPESIPKDGIAAYQQRWATREFGPEHAVEIADIVAKYAKYNAWRKPELVKPDTYSLVNFLEAERVGADWQELEDRAEKIAKELPQNEHDAYYELVLHPVEACAGVTLMNIASGRNLLYANQGRSSATAEADVTHSLFAKDKKLTDYYNHELAGGKWDHMMDQVHLGYSEWYSPQANIEPPLSVIDSPDTSSFGVSVDGQTRAWPAFGPTFLPRFDSLNRQRSWLEVFPIGTQPVQTKVTAAQPWILLSDAPSPSAGKNDHRMWVDIDWAKAPAGESTGTISVSGPSGSMKIEVRIRKLTVQVASEAQGSFAIVDEPLAIDAQDFSANVAAGGVRWEKIPDYGLGISAMTLFPVTAASIKSPAPAPHLDYSIYFAEPGDYEIDLVTNPTLDLYPGRGLSVGVSLGDQAEQIKDVFAGSGKIDQTFLGKEFNQNARNNSRIMRFNEHVNVAGRQTVRILMVDPTIVVEKLMIHRRPLPSSYFGPVPATPVATASASR